MSVRANKTFEDFQEADRTLVKSGALRRVLDVIEWLERRSLRRQQARALRSLDDNLLKDIGLGRGDADQAAFNMLRWR